MKTVFTNGRIILTDRILDGYSVIVEDGVISDVTKSTAAADKMILFAVFFTVFPSANIITKLTIYYHILYHVSTVWENTPQIYITLYINRRLNRRFSISSMLYCKAQLLIY